MDLSIYYQQTDSENDPGLVNTYTSHMEALGRDLQMRHASHCGCVMRLALFELPGWPVPVADLEIGPVTGLPLMTSMFSFDIHPF